MFVKSKRKFGKLLKEMDIFGAPLQLNIYNQEPVFKSVFGGLVSLMIYSIAIAYSIVLSYQWLNWEIQPTVNMQTYPTPFRELLELQSSIFSLSLVNEGFTLKEYQQIASNDSYMYVKNFAIRDLSLFEVKYSGGKNNCQRDKDNRYLFATLCQNISDPLQSHFYSPDKETYGTFLYYGLQYCDSGVTDPLCYSKDELMKHNDNGGNIYWELQLFRDEVDLSNGKVFRVITPYFLQFDNDTEKYLNIQLKVTKAKVFIDSGFFFSDPTTFTIIQDVEPLIIFDKSFLHNQGPTLTISTNNYHVQINIAFPQLTIILSQILSFFQTLGLLGYFISFLNSRKLQQYTEQTLLDTYFPQFKLLKQNKPKYERVKSMRRAEQTLGKKLTADLYQHRDKICQALKGRLNLFSLIQDINQLQLQMRSFGTFKEQRHYRLSFLDDFEKQGLHFSKEVQSFNREVISSDLNPTEEEFYQLLCSPEKVFISKSPTEKIYPLQDKGTLRSQNDIQIIPYEISQRLD